MKRKLSIYLVVIVLLAWTAPGAGIVSSGDIGSAETDVEVGVEYVPPQIEIVEYPDPVGYQDDVYIGVEVTTPGQLEAVDEVVFEFNYTGEKDAGETFIYASQGGLQPEGWEDEVGYVSHEWTLEEDEMWRTDCDNGEWNINVTVYGTEEDCWDHDEETTSVELYREIHWAEDGEAGGSPGQHLYGDDFENDDGKHPEIKITSNANWDLELTSGTAEHEEAEVEDILTVDGDYEEGEDNGNPVWEHTIEIDYYVDIPYGHMHGTYSTAEDGGTSVGHTLSNTET